ncbi:uncharacterized protein PHACADRAFT_259909 [Phanerochaete carnosa HHB-10118-sp]|uniref:DUF302 domain-containing protein n=1 Tax=Phanerochaete carnosa (strain HHB-10118-sp) TaxID=650164 RepID=K5VPV7_PHACS|nr:uncharacterized protein PHACADRAFT_259909 [Phanerochaete carnosa HHB-10118-sp]EKM53493.1 hypothetical protein PHACADRAFT_259909 [Phanerochaete carnosa HHB-10118-sp]
MSLTVSSESHSYTAQRVILTSSKPFDKVIAALDEETNRAGPHVGEVLGSAKSKEEIEQGMSALTDSGKRTFVFFSAQFHSKWIGNYYGQTFDDFVLYTFGNPLYAKEMMTRDSTTGFGIPPRVLVQATKEGGTRIQYDRPSSWFTLNPSPELNAALESLSANIEALLRKALA